MSDGRGDSYNGDGQKGVVKRNPLDLPPDVVRAFLVDMKAFFAEDDRLKRDAIAVRQLHALKAHQEPREKPLRLSDIREMFEELKTSRESHVYPQLTQPPREG